MPKHILCIFFLHVLLWSVSRGVMCFHQPVHLDTDWSAKSLISGLPEEFGILPVACEKERWKNTWMWNMLKEENKVPRYNRIWNRWEVRRWLALQLIWKHLNIIHSKLMKGNICMLAVCGWWSVLILDTRSTLLWTPYCSPTHKPSDFSSVLPRLQGKGNQLP